MLSTVIFATLLLLASMAPSHAEGICDIDKRWASGELKDRDQITISGRITKKLGRRGGDGEYGYDVEDTCPIPATVNSLQPIDCGGQVTITGKFDEDYSNFNFGSITIWAKQVSCK